jgi:NADPH:quinone reductase
VSPFRAGLLGRAIRIHAHGDADAMTLESMPIQKPSHDGVLVRVEAAGVNFIDVYKRSGLYKVPLPCTLGEEGSGAVVAVGAGVSGITPGDRVAWTSVLGSYADYVEVPSAKVVPIPDAVSTREAAAIMLQGMTAHYLATSTFPLKPGDRCLVHAGAGGVGLLLVQLAKSRGAFVIATVGTPEKAALVHGAGADATILYREQDFVAETKRLTDGHGVHVVYDSVGQTTFLKGFDVLVPRGMMVLFGQSSGPVSPLDPQLLNGKGSLFLTRPTLGHYTATRDELLARSGALFEMVANGTLSVRIGAEFPLSEAASAHRALEARLTVGKVLLRP